MNKFLNFFFRELITKSTTDVLPLMLKKNDLKELASSCCDPRALVDRAIEITRQQPQQFLKRLSNEVRFPLLMHPELEFSESIMKELPLSRLEKLGAFPLLKDKQIKALWAVDPFVIQQSLSVTKGFPIYLGLWSEIGNSWDRYANYLLDQEKSERILQNGFEALMLKIAESFEQGENSFLTIQIEQIKHYLTEAELKIDENIIHYYWKRLLAIVAKEPVTISYFLDPVGQVDLFYSYQPRSETILVEQRNKTEIMIVPEQDKGINQKIRPKNIILIDDSTVFTSVLKKYLEKSDFCFRDFVLPSEAIRYLKRVKKPLDLIICDLHMPDISGSQVLQTIRQNDKLSMVPFVLLTSEKCVEEKIKLFELGVDAYIGKDEDPRLIASQLQALLARRTQFNSCS